MATKKKKNEVVTTELNTKGSTVSAIVTQDTTPSTITTTDPPETQESHVIEAPKPPAKRWKSLIKSVLISEEGYTAAFELQLYNTNQDMLNGINRYRSENGFKEDPDETYYALCYCNEPHKKIEIDEVEYTVFGVMFLCRENCSLETIVHECYHMAQDCDRNINLYYGGYGDRLNNGNDPEERIAYRLQDYFGKVQDVFKDLGISQPLREEE
jgi:hypothetical protein